jgi:hypothetical protein
MSNDNKMSFEEDVVRKQRIITKREHKTQKVIKDDSLLTKTQY